MKKYCKEHCPCQTFHADQDDPTYCSVCRHSITEHISPRDRLLVDYGESLPKSSTSANFQFKEYPNQITKLNRFDKKIQLSAELQNVKDVLLDIYENKPEERERVPQLSAEKKRLEREIATLNGKVIWSTVVFPWKEDIESCNQLVFGNKDFRGTQKEIINAFMYGEDCFVVMPTGGGKSLTFQLPAVLLEGITIVVSPLISLINNQVDDLIRKGVKADQVTGQNKEALHKLKCDKPELKLLYVTPERLTSQSFVEILQKLHEKRQIARFVVDEAHCIKEELKTFRGIFPDVPIMALTAIPNHKKTICEVLGMKSPQEFIEIGNRSNLIYEVREKTTAKDTIGEITDFIRDIYPNCTGIVYCFSCKDTKKICAGLHRKGISATYYNGDLPKPEKDEKQKMWQLGDAKVMVATTAFGMGIDKPDVRFVIHYNMSLSVSNYIQESGRAGRDGNPAHCIVYYNLHDTRKMETDCEDLYKMVGYCENKRDCRNQHLGTVTDSEKCQGKCDNCLSDGLRQEVDVTELAAKIIATVNEVGEKIPLGSVVNILQGKHEKRVMEADHHKTQYFGAASRWSKTDIRSVIGLMLVKGYLKQKPAVRMASPLQIGSNWKEGILQTERLKLYTMYQVAKEPPSPQQTETPKRTLRKTARKSLPPDMPPLLDMNDANTKEKDHEPTSTRPNKRKAASQKKTTPTKPPKKPKTSQHEEVVQEVTWKPGDRFEIIGFNNIKIKNGRLFLQCIWEGWELMDWHPFEVMLEDVPDLVREFLKRKNLGHWIPKTENQ